MLAFFRTYTSSPRPRARWQDGMRSQRRVTMSEASHESENKHMSSAAVPFSRSRRLWRLAAGHVATDPRKNPDAAVRRSGRSLEVWRRTSALIDSCLVTHMLGSYLYGCAQRRAICRGVGPALLPRAGPSSPITLTSFLTYSHPPTFSPRLDPRFASSAHPYGMTPESQPSVASSLAMLSSVATTARQDANHLYVCLPPAPKEI